MAKRKRIGLLFLYDEEIWAGGMYYILNIINALNHLEDSRKPELVIFYKDEKIKDRVVTSSYPYVSFLHFYKPGYTLYERILLKGIRLFRRNFLFPLEYPASVAEFVFPCDYSFDHDHNSLKKVRKIYWIPDFQHKHLPQFFDQEELKYRDQVFERLANMKVKLVLSSENAKADFSKFFPEHQCSVQVLPFASVLPAYMHVNIVKLKQVFEIHSSYFLSPNQFWVHKNHLVILKAIALLKNKQLEYQVIFTGKEFDSRNSEYMSVLKQYISEHDISKYVRILGFIDRAELLRLMQDACAVIQPSLFEGWSTVVEDAKAMSQTVILSSLDVHIEQAGDKALYFDPYNEYELAMQMEKCLFNKPIFDYPHYADTIRDYALKVTEL